MKLKILVLAFAFPFAVSAQQTDWSGGLKSAGQIKASGAAVPSAKAQAAGTLVVHAVEIGVGKFHRYDNSVHAYGQNNAWLGFILPGTDGVSGGAVKTPVVYDNADGSVTVQFSNLEELFGKLASLCKERNSKIGALNINAHGMPGRVWFPKNKKQQNGYECAGWRYSAEATDKSVYRSYYGLIGKNEILAIRQMAQSSEQGSYECSSGSPEWKEAAAKTPDIKSCFAPDAQIHFFSCLVGLGRAGKVFTETVAAILLDGEKANVQTSANYGLGDWSMPEGMGFWDYLTDEQLERDNELYPMNRTDREIMQKGVIRLASRNNGKWTSVLVGNRDFMLTGQIPLNPEGNVIAEIQPQKFPSKTAGEAVSLPKRIRIPGTSVYAKRLR